MGRGHCKGRFAPPTLETTPNYLSENAKLSMCGTARLRPGYPAIIYPSNAENSIRRVRRRLNSPARRSQPRHAARQPSNWQEHIQQSLRRRSGSDSSNSDEYSSSSDSHSSDNGTHSGRGNGSDSGSGSGSDSGNDSGCSSSSDSGEECDGEDTEPEDWDMHSDLRSEAAAAVMAAANDFAEKKKRTLTRRLKGVNQGYAGTWIGCVTVWLHHERRIVNVKGRFSLKMEAAAFVALVRVVIKNDLSAAVALNEANIRISKKWVEAMRDHLRMKLKPDGLAAAVEAADRKVISQMKREVAAATEAAEAAGYAPLLATGQARNGVERREGPYVGSLIYEASPWLGAQYGSGISRHLMKFGCPFAAAVYCDLVAIAEADTPVAARNLPSSFYSTPAAATWIAAVGAAMRQHLRQARTAPSAPASAVCADVPWAVKDAVTAAASTAAAAGARYHPAMRGVSKTEDTSGGKWLVQNHLVVSGQLETLSARYHEPLEAVCHHDLVRIATGGHLTAAVNIKDCTLYTTEQVSVMSAYLLDKYTGLLLPRLCSPGSNTAATAGSSHAAQAAAAAGSSHAAEAATAAAAAAGPRHAAAEASSVGQVFHGAAAAAAGQGDQGSHIMMESAAGQPQVSSGPADAAPAVAPAPAAATSMALPQPPSAGIAVPLRPADKMWRAIGPRPRECMTSLAVSISKDRQNGDILSAEPNARFMAAIMESLNHVPPEGYHDMLILNPDTSGLMSAVKALIKAGYLDHKRTFYFDGHGCTNKKGKQLIAAADGQDLDILDGLEIKAHKDKSPLLLVVNSCREGAGDVRAAVPKTGGCSSNTEYSQRMNATRNGALSYGGNSSSLPDWPMWFYMKVTFLRRWGLGRRPSPRDALQIVRTELEAYRQKAAPGSVPGQVWVFNKEDDNTDWFKHGHVPESHWKVLETLDSIYAAAHSTQGRQSHETAEKLKLLEMLLRDVQGWRPFVLTFGLLRVTAQSCDEPDTKLDQMLKHVIQESPEMLLPEICLPLALLFLAAEGSPHWAAKPVLECLPALTHYGCMPGSQHLQSRPGGSDADVKARAKLSVKLEASELELRAVPFVAAALRLPAHDGGLKADV